MQSLLVSISNRYCRRYQSSHSVNAESTQSRAGTLCWILYVAVHLDFCVHIHICRTYTCICTRNVHVIVYTDVFPKVHTHWHIYIYPCPHACPCAFPCTREHTLLCTRPCADISVRWSAHMPACMPIHMWTHLVPGSASQCSLSMMMYGSARQTRTLPQPALGVHFTTYDNAGHDASA